MTELGAAALSDPDAPGADRAAALAESLMSRCAFPPGGRPLECAVSGGADSCALLVLASLSGCEVTAHHVDHGLRVGSDQEAGQVQSLAERFGARFVSHTVTVSPGSNLEARARAARYRVLPATIATGHTLDDRAETIMLNLLRGASRTGLSPQRDLRRHPIRRLRRHETEALCAAFGVVVVHDPTNLDPKHLRNRVRHEVLPMLRQVSGRDIAEVLDRQADVLADEDEFLDRLAREIDPTDAVAVAGAPRALARRAIRNWIIDSWDEDHPPSSASVERVLEVAAGNAVATQIEGSRRVHRQHQKLSLKAPWVA